MNQHGFFRVAAVVPKVNVADCHANAESIISCAREAAARGARVAVFPEMSTTAYTCADLFHSQTLLRASQSAVAHIAQALADEPMMAVVGAPVMVDGALYNCAVAIVAGKVVAIVPKTYLPTYNEFYEKRWWSPFDGVKRYVDYAGNKGVPLTARQLISIDGVKIGIEICEDLWTAIPPSSTLALAGAEIILNLSASDDLIGKYAYLRSLILQQSARCLAAYVYSGAGYGESSTDLVFDGKAFVAENGTMLAQSERWQHDTQTIVADIDIDAIRRDRMHTTSFADCARNNLEKSNGDTNVSHYGLVCVSLPAAPDKEGSDLLRSVNPLPFVPSDDAHRAERCDEIINIQVAGLARRLDATHTRSLVVGISGGLDSTLALLVAERTFRRLNLPVDGIIGVTMPGFGTTGRTYNNSLQLMRALGVTIREIPIAEAVNIHFRDIGHDPSVTDVTYENSQARERTQILMDIANQCGGMVLGTGDLSELALGWATYNGDHMSMYGVNAGVPKTLVRHLVRWFADDTDNAAEHRVLLDIIDTPISPELTPAAPDGTIAQKTEDLVGPYELHDFFLYYTLRYGFSPSKIYFLATKAFPERDCAEIKHWLRTFFRRFFNQQFKRSCLPDGPKVGSVCLSPRGDWRMPSDASSALWLAEIDTL